MTNSYKNFDSLVKDKTILQAITNMGIEVPTEIQIKSIPLILEGKNIIAESATGTGKTVAFLAGILPKINKERKVQALIVVPTRELALQVFKEVKKMSEIKRLLGCAVYGGDSVSEQARQIKNSDIVIGTPGRIIDQIGRGNLNLKGVKYLVLDEADRMCDMGFSEDISKIIDQIPKERQTLMFSATITRDVTSIEKKYIPKAERISVESKVDPSKLLQEFYVVRSNQKFSLLLHLIKENQKKSIVFSNTRREVDVIYNNLVKNGVEAFKLHGGLEQRKRTHTIEKYHAHKSAVLISSDVSARGIHIDNLEYIYNYDIPKDDTQYVHRIGRTARAGEEGKAITFISAKEETTFVKMCRRYGFTISKKEVPDVKVVSFDRTRDKEKLVRGKSDSRSRDFFNKQIGFLRKPRSSQNPRKTRSETTFRDRKRAVSDSFSQNRTPREDFSKEKRGARDLPSRDFKKEDSKFQDKRKSDIKKQKKFVKNKKYVKKR